MRLGLLGGAFDPFHLGHLLVADDVRRRLGLDEVLFVPTFSPPHRRAPAAAFRHRLAMARLGSAVLPGLGVLGIESRLPTPSYTVRTLAALRAARPGTRPWFILGADQYAAMCRWFRPGEVARLARLVVVSRPGEPRPRLWPGHSRSRVRFLDVVAVDIAGADIRARLASGRSVRYMLPTAVAAYAGRHRLYRPTAH
jgi:nicotinate-nucleotide adenylyltransferase